MAACTQTGGFRSGRGLGGYEWARRGRRSMCRETLCVWWRWVSRTRCTRWCGGVARRMRQKRAVFVVRHKSGPSTCVRVRDTGLYCVEAGVTRALTGNLALNRDFYTCTTERGTNLMFQLAPPRGLSSNHIIALSATFRYLWWHHLCCPRCVYLLLRCRRGAPRSDQRHRDPDRRHDLTIALTPTPVAAWPSACTAAAPTRRPPRPGRPSPVGFGTASFRSAARPLSTPPCLSCLRRPVLLLRRRA